MPDDVADEHRSMLAAEYVLGLLPADEARAFEADLDVSPATHADYAFWAEHVARLTDDVAEVTPPAEILTRLRADLFPAAPAAKKPSLLNRLGLLPAMGAGLVAALVVLFLVGQVVERPQVGVGALATLVSEDGSLAVEVAYTEFSDTIRIDRAAGTPPDGQVFQLWLIRDDQPPISLGVLPEEAESTLQIAEAVQPLLRGARCAISVEPPGGSPTGQPTGAVVAEARIVWDA